MSGRFILWVFTILLLNPFNGVSREGLKLPSRFAVRNFSLEEGLSQCVATSICLDRKGFVWIGTFDGLNRFDGNHLLVYRHKPGDSTSLPSSKIFKIYADAHQHLWLSTSTGISVFDTRTGKIVSPPLIQKGGSSWVAPENDDFVWFYLPDKTFIRMNCRDFSYTRHSYRIPDSLKTGIYQHHYAYPDFQLLIDARGGIVRLNTQDLSCRYIPPSDSSYGFYGISGRDKYGCILLKHKNYPLQCFDPKQNQFTTLPALFSQVQDMNMHLIRYDSVYDALFFCSYGQGLAIYEYKTGELKRYTKQDPAQLLSNNYLQSLAVDKLGLVYIGHDGTGIDVWDPYIKKFETIQRDDPDDLKKLRFIRRIKEDTKGRLLFGTSGSGLVRYDRQTSLFEFFNSSNVLPGSDDFIIEMHQRPGELWLGYNGHGIAVVDDQTLRIRYKIEPGPGTRQLSDGVIWAFAEDSLDNLWVGTRHNGINKINLNNGLIKQITRLEYPELTSGNRCLFTIKKGLLLLGTENGLYEVDARSDRVRKVFPLRKDQLAMNSIKAIHRDYKGRFWLCTDGWGILVLNPDYTFIYSFNTGNVLNNDVVYGILPQNDTTFWFSSNAGIGCLRWNERVLYQGAKVHITLYDEKNGLQSNEFNTGAYLKLRDGSLAFGGLNGVNVFNPNEIKTNPIVPETYIRDFRVFENPYLTDTQSAFLERVILKHNENSISITFGTIGLSVPGKTKYMYRLLGNDDDWIQADTRNYVSYTHLNPGLYEFQVKACNYDGIWNPAYTQLRIEITKPFYKTWWFILISCLIILQAGFQIFRYRMKIAREKEELHIRHMREIAEVEMRALRAQINPHFVFNSLNSINSFILKQDNKTASRYLVKFSQLVRSILNHSSSTYISLEEELKTVELYLQIEGMRFSNQFSFLIDVAPDIPISQLQLPSLLLQPYVENAIWHGLLHKEGEKQIIIRIFASGSSKVYIQIEDNGIGRKKAGELEAKSGAHRSFGMQLGENRLRLMNADKGHAGVEVIDKISPTGEPEGTIIKITIPAFPSDSSTVNP